MVTEARSIHDLIARDLGVRASAEVNPDGVASVGVAATRLLRANPMRYALVFVNLSGATMYLAPDPDVSASYGIRVEANGGRVALNWRDDLVLPAREWYALSTIAGSAFFLLTVEGQP